MLEKISNGSIILGVTLLLLLVLTGCGNDGDLKITFFECEEGLVYGEYHNSLSETYLKRPMMKEEGKIGMPMAYDKYYIDWGSCRKVGDKTFKTHTTKITIINN